MFARQGPVIVVLCASAAACGDWHSDIDGLTEQDNALLQTMVLSATAQDPGNEWSSDEKVRALGQKLFFAKGLAVRADATRAEVATVACSDCHSPRDWFSDPRSKRNVSAGIGGTFTKRNSPSLVNVAFYPTLGWDGRADSVWGQTHIAFKAGATMAGTKASAVAYVKANYEAEFDAAFGAHLATDSIDESYAKVLKAWGAYITALVSRNSPFDRFASGADRNALTSAQKRGLLLFIGKAGCIQCHSGAMFSDFQFHNIGIGQTGDDVANVDLGRFDGLNELRILPYRPTANEVPPSTSQDVNRFRTKGLRHVAKTGPYYHAGQAATLKDVVWFYNQGGDRAGENVSPFLVPLGLTDDEQADLVAFLESLTGDEVPGALRCDTASPVARVYRVSSPARLSDDGGVIGGDGGVWVPSDAGSIRLFALDGGADAGVEARWYEPWAQEFTCP